MAYVVRSDGYITIPLEHLSLAGRLFSAARVKGVNDCWIFQGSLDDGGYGQLKVDDKTVGAHRVSYTIFFGDTDKHVMHRCDVPACVNPRHLMEGTHAENMADMSQKLRNRAPRVGNGKPRLTPEQSAELIRLRNAGLNWSQLGRLFSLSPPGARDHYKVKTNAI